IDAGGASFGYACRDNQGFILRPLGGPTPTISDPPTNAVAAAGAEKATVSWTPPASDGGSPITHYSVTSTPDDLTATVDGSITSASVTGLANGTSYTFTVTATNSVG